MIIIFLKAEKQQTQNLKEIHIKIILDKSLQVKESGKVIDSIEINDTCARRKI